MIYPHENILKSKNTETANNFYNKSYLKMRKRISRLTFSDDADFVRFAKNLNDYDKAITEFENKNDYNFQGKLKSSFYEEICCYLFCNLPKIKNGDFKIFNSKRICTGLFFKQSSDLAQKTKHVDFCIGKEIKISVDSGNTTNLIKPIIAIEVKTYLDATMFGEIQNSFSLLRNVSPDASTYVLMGYNSVGKEHFIARKNILINEMFALRKGEKEAMEPEAIKMFYKEISDAVERYGEDYEVPKCGRLLRSK